ncbi:hypothetical protein K435DRAFT_105553 [Dendrothele bispora CBS 962.96]|uniref:F-box domain-containing protein n=1 Tax=Dendrothele bispora (strain CBS 962.96) TaxID=1314807 RepID=A0A4S8MQT8_DENBC|nr:hypothetical protein K435DRAFT_105553 [Dendrothele bispora CBS 962.96]
MSGNDSTLDGLDCLSTWLKRTGRRRLLSLIVDCSNLSQLRYISTPWTDPFTVLLSILLEYAPRWERLEFNHINESSLNILCAELHDDCLPGLKSLSFSGEEAGVIRISDYRYRFPVQWRLSKLVCLSLVFDLIDLENLQMGFHLSQLTSLTLRTRRKGWISGQMDFHGVLDLLSCCPRLEECNLQYDWRPTIMTELTRTRTVLLENLTIFWFASLRDPQYLLRALELPCLREFEFQYLVSTVNNPLLLDRSPLDDLLNRSGLKCKSWSHQPETNMCQLKAIPIEETL